MAGRAWTVTERRQAVAWRKAGVRRDEIARRLGRTPIAVKRVLTSARAGYAPGEARRPWSDADVALLIQLRQQGISRQEVAVRLQRSVEAVDRQMHGRHVRYRCPRCAQRKPASAFVWQYRVAIPPCRDCAATHRRPRRAEPVIDIDTDREGRLLQLKRQLQQSNSSTRTPGAPHLGFAVGRYPMPDLDAWVARFTERPEVLGRIIHDVIAEHWWIDHPSDRTGRRPDVRFTVADLRTYVPTVAAQLVPEVT